ncbi:MAG: DUF3054 domain-containing protein [Actinobacteria bacterium]|nr:DUF3054 domain-containing protein [Actinomycetota bacterium]
MHWYLGLDAAAVAVFAAVGRLSHEEPASVTGVAGTAAPFLIALAAAWAATRAWRAPLSWPTGIGVWLVTAAGGMLLRRFAFGDGIAAGFLVAGTAFLGLFLVGWRAVALWIRAS